MSDSCLLETEGYSILIEFLELRPEALDIRIRTTFTLNQHLGSVSFTTMPSAIFATDLEALFAYFEQHMRKVALDSHHVSDEYVEIEMHFQVQALQGTILSEGDGEFSVRFLVNVGRAKIEHAYSFMGCESVISVQQAHAFINAGRVVLKKYNALLSMHNAKH